VPRTGACTAAATIRCTVAGCRVEQIAGYRHGRRSWQTAAAAHRVICGRRRRDAGRARYRTAGRKSGAGAGGGVGRGSGQQSGQRRRGAPITDGRRIDRDRSGWRVAALGGCLTGQQKCPGALGCCCGRSEDDREGESVDPELFHHDGLTKMVMVPTALPEFQLVPPVVCRQIRSPTGRLAVVTVIVWSVAAAPFALKLPEWSAVPAEQPTPLGAWFTEPSPSSRSRPRPLRRSH